VKEIQAEKKRVVFDTVCTVGTTVVLEGEATLMVASRQDIAGTPGNDSGATAKTSAKAPQAAE